MEAIMATPGYNPRTSGLVRRVQWNQSFNDERYQLIESSEYKVYALKPQYFTPSNITDLSGKWGPIETRLKVNSIQVKGAAFSNDTLASQSIQLAPVTLGNNPLTGQDPLVYAQLLGDLDKKGNDEYITSTPGVNWNMDKLLFGPRIGGQAISPTNGLTYTINLVTNTPNAYFDTTSSYSISLGGGGSISVPAYYVKQNPELKVVFTQTALNTFFYTATLGDYNTTGTFSISDAQRCVVSGAVSYFVQNGIYDNRAMISSEIQGLIGLVSGLASATGAGQAALSSMSSIWPIFEKWIFSAIAYENRKMSEHNIGGSITNLEYGSVFPGDDTSSIGKKVSNFLNVSYPVKAQTSFLSYGDVAYAWITPADLEKNKIKSFEVNQVFASYDSLKTWITTNLGDVQLVNIDGQIFVEYDEYNSYWRSMLDRGVLLE